MARHTRRIVHVLRPHHRLAAIRRNQGLAHPPFAVLVDGGDGFGRLVLRCFFDARVREKRHSPGLRCALQQRSMNIDTVNHRIGVAKALTKGLARLQAPNQTGI